MTLLRLRVPTGMTRTPPRPPRTAPLAQSLIGSGPGGFTVWSTKVDRTSATPGSEQPVHRELAEALDVLRNGMDHEVDLTGERVAGNHLVVGAEASTRRVRHPGSDCSSLMNTNASTSKPRALRFTIAR